MAANVFADPDIQQCMVLSIAESFALVAAAAPLVGRLQADSVNFESLKDEVDYLCIQCQDSGSLAHIALAFPRLSLGCARMISSNPQL